VTSSARIDEAVVHLTLRAKCNARATRQYTLLADVASELAGAEASAQPVRRPDSVPRSAKIGDAPTPVAAGSAALAGAGSAIAANPKPATAAAPKQNVTRPVRSSPKPAAASANAAEPHLAKAATAQNLALEDLQRRVDEIAKWQASSTNADELLKSEARTKALESDIRGLQMLAAKNQQNIQIVAAAVESNGAQDISRPLAYGLGALLLACVVALAYVAQRMRVGGYAAAPWWSGAGERSATPAGGVAARVTAPIALSPLQPRPVSVEAAVPEKAGAPSKSDGAAQPDAPSTDGDAGKATANLAVAPATISAHHAGADDHLTRHDFAPGAAGTMKAINTKEMLDVRQQAEFFMALGQHDEAVRVLESSIRGSAECNPLVFLDLLKIFHTLSRRADFERYREEFNAQFTGRIPPYASFLSEGNGLDAYEDICNQIVVLWPTEYTVDYIEQCLVRMPEDDPEQGIDLEAFKDLLMLYGVLKRLDHGVDSNLAPFIASRSEASQDMPISPPLTAPAPIVPVEDKGESSQQIDIDLDLDLDLGVAHFGSTPSEHDNMIDFDISNYVAEKYPTPPKK
jgi:hypothetical protein